MGESVKTYGALARLAAEERLTGSAGSRGDGLFNARTDRTEHAVIVAASRSPRLGKELICRVLTDRLPAACGGRCLVHKGSRTLGLPDSPSRRAELGLVVCVLFGGDF